MNPCSVSTSFATSSKRLLVAIVVFPLAGCDEWCPYHGHYSRILCFGTVDVKQRSCRQAMQIGSVRHFARRKFCIAAIHCSRLPSLHPPLPQARESGIVCSSRACVRLDDMPATQRRL